ncbi:MAG: hypothetical protein WBG66_01330 [Geitlerinemataceae cyanobacterium]
MAKRRNLKKEKAARNQAYARQFRKKSTRSFSQNRRYSRSDSNETGTGTGNEAGNGTGSGNDSQ